MTSDEQSAPLDPMAGARPSETLNERVARNLRRARIALGLRPADICRRTGIRPNAYSQWESAKQVPRLDQAFLLCERLGYTLEWIYRGDPSGLPKRIADNLPSVDGE